MTAQLQFQVQLQGSAVFSSPGTRGSQEDHSLVNREKRIFAVADGFGGPEPGARASREACEAVKGFLYREAGDLDATLPFELRSYYSLAGNVLFNSLVHANRMLLKLNRGKGVHERGGASIVAAWLDGELLALASVGVCSAWLLRGGCAESLVTPRSYSRLMDPFQQGMIADFQVPLAALGIAEDLEPEIFECRIQPGDWLCLHTDGLGPLVREELVKLQQRGLVGGDAEPRPAARSSEEACREAVRLLEGMTFDDNATVALLVF